MFITRRLPTALLPLVLTAACTTSSAGPEPIHALPPVPAALAKQQADLQQQLIDQRRATNAALPILKSAIDHCGPIIQRRAGLFLLNAYGWPSDDQPTAATLGMNESLLVAGVARGSAADRAGVRAGDRVLMIGGAPAPMGKGAIASADTLTQEAYGALGVLPLVLRRDSTTVEVTLDSEFACPYYAAVSVSPTVDLWVQGNTIVVTTGMLTVLSDAELAYALSHVFAHELLSTVPPGNAPGSQAVFANAISVIASVAVTALALGATTALGVRPPHDVILVGPHDKGQTDYYLSRSSRYSATSELEADHFALYLAARAGDSLAAALELWKTVNRGQRDLDGTTSYRFAEQHQTGKNRTACITRTIAAIEPAEQLAQPLAPVTGLIWYRWTPRADSASVACGQPRPAPKPPPS